MVRNICLLFLFLSVFILSGCSIESDNNNGVELQMTTDTILDGSVSTTSTNVTGDTDDFPNRFLTPLSFTAAIKSAKLIKEGDTSASYTIFDQGSIANPIVASITAKGFVTRVAGNNKFPSSGTYNKVQLEISFLEMTIPNCVGSFRFFNCRLRYYLSSMADLILNVNVAQGDILLEDDFLTPGSPYLNWLNRNSSEIDPFNVVTIFGNTIVPSVSRFIPAAPSFINLRSQITPLQVPISQFPVPVTDPFVMTINLDSPLVIPPDPSGLKKVVLNFDLKGLLFFDDTNINRLFDPWGTSCQSSFNCDGRLDSMSILGRSSADFYPGIPNITATSE